MIAVTSISYTLDRSDNNLFLRFHADTGRELNALKKDVWFFGGYNDQNRRRPDKFWYGSVDLAAKEFSIRRLRAMGRLSSIEIKGKEIDNFYEKSLVVKLGVPLSSLLPMVIVIGVTIFLFGQIEINSLIFFLIIAVVKIGDTIMDLRATTTRLEQYISSLATK